MSETSNAVEDVLRWMVDEPDAVRARERRGRRGQIVEVWVAPGDMGAVIGRSGRTAGALRTLLDSRGESEDCNYDLKILEPEEPHRDR